MTLPFHLFGHGNAPDGERADNLRIVPKTDLQWGRRLFRAPALATPAQRIEELRFASEFRAKDLPRR